MTTTYPVTVDVNAEGKIVCTPNRLVVTDPNALLAFSLLTPGYAFPETGAIVLRETSPTFPYPSWTVQSSMSALLDLNTVNGDFPYTVTVVETSTGRQHKHDPVIINDC